MDSTSDTAATSQFVRTPLHWWVGTSDVQHAQMVELRLGAHGERNHFAKLTAAQVLEKRANYALRRETHTAIASRYDERARRSHPSSTERAGRGSEWIMREARGADGLGGYTREQYTLGTPANLAGI
jgi:hypothetical protein